MKLLQAYKRWEKQNGGEESLLPGLNLNNEQVFFVAFAQVLLLSSVCAFVSDCLLYCIVFEHL